MAGMATSAAASPLSATAARATTATTTARAAGGGGGTGSRSAGGSGGSAASSWLSAAVLFAPSAVCAYLCKWQVDRYQWKRHEIDAREAALTARDLTAVDLLAMTKRGELPQEYARVFVEGELDTKNPARTVHITPRTRSVHGSPIKGSIVITALKPRRPRNAPYVLVNRGWAPETWTEPRGGSCVRSPGVIRDSETPSAFVPDNNPVSASWHWIDVPAIAAAMGLPPDTTRMIQLVHEGARDTGKAAPTSYPAPPALDDLRGFKVGEGMTSGLFHSWIARLINPGGERAFD